jgi:hypothetical protein
MGNTEQTGNRITNRMSQSHYLGITGGNEKSSYSISLSYNSEEGVFDYDNKSYFERLGFRVNSEHKLKKYLTLGENLTYTHRYRKGLGVTTIHDNFMRNLLQASPLIEPYDLMFMMDSEDQHSWKSRLIDCLYMHYNYNERKNNDDLIGDIYMTANNQGLKFRSILISTWLFRIIQPPTIRSS